MGLSVTFVSGPRCSGKSTLIHGMIHRLWKSKPHYVRLVGKMSGKRRPVTTEDPPAECGVASARWLDYDEEHIFEILPQTLAGIHRHDRYGSVIIEADADPALRHAYPYDHRIFVMPLPDDTDSVFRKPRRAANELQRVLDDTAAFASEIFGLHEESEQEDVDPSESREDLTDTQIRGFLQSPLGDELATRIQLQTPYHGLVESDAVVVNSGVGKRGPETAECLRRIERLLERVRGATDRESELFLCDLLDGNGKVSKRLFKSLKPMCRNPAS